jgi:hypothetical protein
MSHQAKDSVGPENPETFAYPLVTPRIVIGSLITVQAILLTNVKRRVGKDKSETIT